MKKIVVFVLCVCLLFALTACNSASANELTSQPQTEPVPSILSSESEQSELTSQPETESISSIINSASSVEYKLNSEWISTGIHAAETKDFIKRLTELFPEQFGEVASAYMPEDIVIKFNFEQSAQHNVNVNSSAVEVREVTISTIEISSSGIVFLLPQGTALAKIENVGTVLTPAN